jgi:hypothetical protein
MTYHIQLLCTTSGKLRTDMCSKTRDEFKARHIPPRSSPFSVRATYQVSVPIIIHQGKACRRNDEGKELSGLWLSQSLLNPALRVGRLSCVVETRLWKPRIRVKWFHMLQRPRSGSHYSSGIARQIPVSASPLPVFKLILIRSPPPHPSIQLPISLLRGREFSTRDGFSSCIVTVPCSDDVPGGCRG